MKTYEEALRSVLVHRSEVTQQEYELLQHAANAYTEIVEEIRANPRTSLITDLLITALINGQIDIHTALLTALVNGVIVGMEMEKQNG